MKSGVYILLIILFVVAIVLGAYFVFTKKSSVNPPPITGSLPPVFSTSTPPTTQDKLVIGTSAGSVTVKNFYKNPELITPDGQTVVIVSTTDYSVVYSVPDSSLSIALLSKPIDSAKKKAEDALLEKLGVSKIDACKLRVWVGVPVSIDPSQAGRNLGLSFCAGAL